MSEKETWSERRDRIQATLPRLSRLEFFSRRQIKSSINDIFEQSYKRVLFRRYVSGSHNSPHGFPWHSCLTGDTEVVTRQGIKPIRELAASGKAEILTGYGSFKECEVNSYGQAPVIKLHLRKHKQTKVVQCTPNHRWVLSEGPNSRPERSITTEQLEVGDKLNSLKAQVFKNKQKPTPFAFPQGFVYGDGTTRLQGRSFFLWVHHNGKDESMLKHFANHETKVFNREDSGMAVTEVRGLPTLWKQAPDFRESRSFLLSWLAGYFAADGCVDTKGYASIASASLESINIVRGIAAICGIRYGQIGTSVVSGTLPGGKKYENRTMHTLRLNPHDLPEWFFLLDKHRSRIQSASRRESSERFWKVEKIENMRKKQEVFCAVVPSGTVFGLTDDLMTGNSIHASQYPGNYKFACQREHLYRLANVPNEKPAIRRLHLTAQAGLAIEDDLVRMLEENGRLISAGPDAERQTGFKVEELWLTGTVDSAIAIGNRAVPVEIKTKHESHIAEMRAGTRGPDDKHVRQIKAQLGLIRVAQESGELWADLKQAQYGYIYYHPRDSKYNPSKPVETAEFYVGYDKDFFESGTKFIERTQKLWNSGELPSDGSNKRHPMGWHWSKDPCKFCNYKPSCRLDHLEGVTALEASNSLTFAKEIDPEYDYLKAREVVAERWDTALVEPAELD